MEVFWDTFYDIIIPRKHILRSINPYPIESSHHRQSQHLLRLVGCGNPAFGSGSCKSIRHLVQVQERFHLLDQRPERKSHNYYRRHNKQFMGNPTAVSLSSLKFCPGDVIVCRSNLTADEGQSNLGNALNEAPQEHRPEQTLLSNERAPYPQM